MEDYPLSDCTFSVDDVRNIEGCFHSSSSPQSYCPNENINTCGQRSDTFYFDDRCGDGSYYHKTPMISHQSWKNDKTSFRLPPSFLNASQQKPSPPLDCCPHNEQNPQHKYLLTFDSSLSESTNDCFMTEKLRCKAFWNFVDNEPTLLNVIQDGEFVQENLPERAQGKLPVKKTNPSKSQEMAAANEKLHQEERKRFQTLRDKTVKLQLRSGQQPFKRQATEPTQRPKSPRYADLCEETLGDAFQEMNIFDNTLRTTKHSPSGTPPVH